MKQILYVLFGVLTGFFLAGVAFLAARPPAGQPIVLEPAPTKAPIVVHVIGAVVRPGVYALPEGSRVQDAVMAAGGLLAEANPNAINLAAKLEDGQQVAISDQSGRVPLAVTPTAAFEVIEPTKPAPESGDLININTASQEELESLPGIGPTLAQRIIDYRTEHGPFKQIEDIMNVPGIGPATFDQIADLITVE